MVSENYRYNTSCTTIFLKDYSDKMLRCPYKDYGSLIRWKLTGFYFLQLLYAIYYSVMTHLHKGKKVIFL
jgi:hypothetical protein